MDKTQSQYKKYSIFIVCFAFLIQYINIGLVVDGMNVLYPALEAKFGWTRGQLGGATSAAVYIAIISGFVVGTLIMKYNIKPILTIAMALLGLDVIFLSRTTEFSQFAVAMMMIQILTIPLMMGSFALVANWFKAKRGTILGIVTIGAPACSATFVIIGTKFSMAYGYEDFYTGFGIFIVLLALFGMVFIKNRPEEIGCGIDGLDINKDEMARDEKMRERDGGHGTIWTFKKMMANKEMWLISVSWGLIYLMMTGIMSTAIPRFMDVGIPINTALMFFSVAAMLGMPFSYFWGWLDDKVGTPKACIIFAFSYILGCICFLYGSADNMAMAFGGVLAIALTTGGMPNLQPSLQAWVYGRKEFVPTLRYTSVFHNMFRGSAFAVMGIIYNKYHSYDMAYLSFIVLTVVCIACFALIRTTYDPENSSSVFYRPKHIENETELEVTTG